MFITHSHLFWKDIVAMDAAAETRFAHLLQPIRELTKNWEIDVASDLADYLEELDDMAITFDGGRTTLNFAEAALLIQGSTCIYSKKVEHLYNLVFQTLDYISDRNKRGKEAATSGEDGANGTRANKHKNETGLDTLDKLDHISTEVSQHVDLKKEPTTRVEVAPLVPMSLVPPEAMEKQKLSLISLKGEVLGSCKDYRMNTFTPDPQGIIHLNQGSLPITILRDALAEALLCPIALFESHGPGGAGPAAGDPGTAVARDGGGDDNDDGGENFLPLEDNGMEVEMEMDQGPEEHIDRHQAPSEGRMLRERREVQPSEDEQRNRRMMEEEKAQAANVWRLHDPYATFREDNPLKTGKCYKVPQGLDDAGKRKRKGPSVLQEFWSWYTGTFDPPERKLKNGPAFTDLNYIYLAKMKEKLKTRKRILRKTGVLASDEELKRTYLQLDEREDGGGDGQPEGLRLHPPQDDEHSDDDHEPLADIPAEFGGDQDFIMPEPQIDGMSYEDLVKKSVEQFLINSQGYAQETELSRRVKIWEDVIRPELALQEERPTFDIHDYGDRVVAALGGVGNRRSFASIVHGLDNFEACKYMLASLQLANDYTVEVDRTEGLEETIDSMGLTLLSKLRANQRFKQALTAATADPM